MGWGGKTNNTAGPSFFPATHTVHNFDIIFSPILDYFLTRRIDNMAPEPDSRLQGASLTADYTSPGSSKTFSHSLPSITTPSTAEKTAYLSALRKSVVQLQEHINGFLTTKMEEDRSLAGKAGVKADEKAEEENYGEEKVEDEG